MSSFWDEPERVEEFAARDPDRRLVALVEAHPDPGALQVLDLGCAGGRNASFLAERGCDVIALDSSKGMVARTRERLAALLGTAEAERRVRLGRMDDLGWAADSSFDLVLALGIYQHAADAAEWGRALAETARVLRPGGRLLVAAFTPRTTLGAEPLRRLPGPHPIYEGHGSGRLSLLEAPELDAEMRRHGLHADVPTETVVRPTERGQRVTANGLYVKRR